MHRIRGFWSEFLNFQTKQQQKNVQSFAHDTFIKINYNVLQDIMLYF